MPARLDSDQQTVGGNSTAGGGFDHGPQYSLMNFLVYAVIAFVLIALALVLLPNVAGNFENLPNDETPPLGVRGE